MEEFIIPNGSSLTSTSAAGLDCGEEEEDTDLFALSNGSGEERVGKLRHHFTNEEDLHLLRHVVSHNPFGSRGKRGRVWETIETLMRQQGFDISAKSCQDRLSRLIRTFVSEEIKTTAICGQMMNNIPEISQLLQQIIELKQEGGIEVTPNSRKYHSSAIPQTCSFPPTPFQPNKRTSIANGSINSKRRIDETEEEAAPPHLLDSEMHRLKRTEIELKREEVELRKEMMTNQTAEWKRRAEVDEFRFRKEAQLRETTLRVETEKNELERERLSLKRYRQEMEKKKQELEIAERTQQLETSRQQQQVLLQFLTKKLAE